MSRLLPSPLHLLLAYTGDTYSQAQPTHLDLAFWNDESQVGRWQVYNASLD